MFDFRQKRKLRNIYNSRFTQVILLILTIIVLFSVYDRYLIAREMAERRFAVEADIENLNKREEVLNKEVNYLSDERGVEAEMRRQFDIVREGEQAVIILGEKEDANEKSTTTTSTTTKRAWYKFW